MTDRAVNIEALYAALDQKRQVGRLSWRELAQRLAISPSTFTRMAQGRRPDVDTFAILLRWLNMPVESFMVEEAGDVPPPEPMAMISSYLRAARNLRPEDAEALEDIIQVAYRRLMKEK